jgi:polyphosphate kinase 2 (PPK2 family)
LRVRAASLHAASRIHVQRRPADCLRMSGTPSVERLGTGSDNAKVDRATLAISKALKEKRREAEAMVRLIEGADASGKGRHVDYQA